MKQICIYLNNHCLCCVLYLASCIVLHRICKCLSWQLAVILTHHVLPLFSRCSKLFFPFIFNARRNSTNEVAWPFFLCSVVVNKYLPVHLLLLTESNTLWPYILMLLILYLVRMIYIHFAWYVALSKLIMPSFPVFNDVHLHSVIFMIICFFFNVMFLCMISLSFTWCLFFIFLANSCLLHISVILYLLKSTVMI